MKTFNILSQGLHPKQEQILSRNGEIPTGSVNNACQNWADCYGSSNANGCQNDNICFRP